MLRTHHAGKASIPAWAKGGKCPSLHERDAGKASFPASGAGGTLALWGREEKSAPGGNAGEALHSVMSATVNRSIAAGQVVIAGLMIACAAIGPFPSPVPLLFVVAAAGTANAAFPLMRTFGSALLGGTAAVAIALAAVPFTSCASPHPSPMFVCTGDAPSWHLAGAVIAAGLCGASLVLARVAAQAEQAAAMTAVLDELRDEILRLQ